MFDLIAQNWTIVVMVLVFAIIAFLMWRPSRNKQAKEEYYEYYAAQQEVDDIACPKENVMRLGEKHGTLGGPGTEISVIPNNHDQCIIEGKFAGKVNVAKLPVTLENVKVHGDDGKIEVIVAAGGKITFISDGPHKLTITPDDTKYRRDVPIEVPAKPKLVKVYGVLKEEGLSFWGKIRKSKTAKFIITAILLIIGTVYAINSYYDEKEVKVPIQAQGAEESVLSPAEIAEIQKQAAQGVTAAGGANNFSHTIHSATDPTQRPAKVTAKPQGAPDSPDNTPPPAATPQKRGLKDGENKPHIKPETPA